MPILEFRCGFGHITEVLYKTFKAAGEAPQTTACIHCRDNFLLKRPVAKRVEFTATGAPSFRGDGWTPKSSS